jgi:hypothetical protein
MAAYISRFQKTNMVTLAATQQKIDFVKASLV